MNADDNSPVPGNDNSVQIPDDGGTSDVPSAGSLRRRETRPGRSLLQVARLLPLVTVAAWVVTIFVPVLDSGNAEGPRITITSWGDVPLGTGELNPGLIVVWVLIVTIALLPGLFGLSHWWSATAILVGVIILVGLVAVVIAPPFLMWDGQTKDGMPTGGMEVASPAFGFVLWLIGSMALLAAGVCGWIGGQRTQKEGA